MSSEAEIGSQIAEDFPNDEALEAAQHVLLRQALGKTAAHVVSASPVVAEPADSDHVQSTVGLSIAAPMQPHPAGLSGIDGNRCDTAQAREPGLRAEPVDVLPGADQQLGRVTGPDPDPGDERGSRPGYEPVQVGLDGGDLRVQLVYASGQSSQGHFRGLKGLLQSGGIGAEPTWWSDLACSLLFTVFPPAGSVQGHAVAGRTDRTVTGTL